MCKAAIVVTYSFAEHASVILCKDYDSAIKALKEYVEEEYRIDTEENGWKDSTEYTISEDGKFARLVNHFDGHDDITEWCIGDVYDKQT